MVSRGLPDTRVPIVFFGAGVRPGALPTGTALDAIAPTLESITGFRRAHPEVRTGEAIDGRRDRGTRRALARRDDRVEGPRHLRPRAEPHGVAVPAASAARPAREPSRAPPAPCRSTPPPRSPRSAPEGDRRATASRAPRCVEDDGEVAVAWSTPGAGSVIATFADDLDHDSGGRARVAAIVTDPVDRGIVGNGWYLDAVDDDTTIRADDPARSATKAAAIVASDDLGGDEVTDVLGVVLDGEVGRVDAATSAVVSSIRDLVPNTTFVVTAHREPRRRWPGRGRRSASPTDVDAALGAPRRRGGRGGRPLPRSRRARGSLAHGPAGRGRDARRRRRAAQPLFDDVYPSFAVAFSRYC